MNTIKEVVEKEIEHLKIFAAHLDEPEYQKALDLIQACKGKIVVTGVGKSGHVASKIAATMASTGTPAFFVHPGEACHGDLGMIQPNDLVIAISHSGESSEIMTILPIVKSRGIKIITITSKPQSSMALISDVHLCTYITEEAGRLNLAPTSSTTTTMVLGDGIAIALAERNNFTPIDFAASHPGGALGKRLLVHNRNVMHTGSEIPFARLDNTLGEAILEVSEKKLGFVIVLDAEDRLYGVFTDGDIRRAFTSGFDFRTAKVSDVIKKGCYTVKEDQMAYDSLVLMEEKKVTTMVVVDGNNRVVGAFNIHDLFQSGIRK
ncbi:MAG: KpsF/GutQ family sugar-phosphate isomerase [Ruminobacter sp.]|uniref:Arabinose 5-phosphate isomerase n=1 Tax=Ruminobacter amylophilus TaxID=867 RepID=A0A662ZEG1_9GAMM|nr:MULTISPECIES: KpsF/GutQ family sugar-phosphate isomerase [Ruminobacter]MBQ3776217.1 KpsF/GutQ family sugar-phosphate isomerase [Ruminobacter sp.]SFP04280.1 arabinose-5-phosphate isomerase [Ruminobacter amylophilus]